MGPWARTELGRWLRKLGCTRALAIALIATIEALSTSIVDEASGKKFMLTLTRRTLLAGAAYTVAGLWLAPLRAAAREAGPIRITNVDLFRIEIPVKPGDARRGLMSWRHAWIPMPACVATPLPNTSRRACSPMRGFGNSISIFPRQTTSTGSSGLRWRVEICSQCKTT